jgi:ABC-type antimicrobial peptide transport system permease subunit
LNTTIDESQNQLNTLSIPVDAEHDGIRLAVAGIFVVVAIISFFVLSATIPAESINLLAILGALVIAAAFTSLIERQLKARWPSGRALEITPEALAIRNKKETQASISPSADVQLMFWRFEVKRRTRVPKGWYVVAAGVKNKADDTYITVYTLMSPEKYEAFDTDSRFTVLKKSSDEDLRMAGEQKRLHGAESYRWREGCEVSSENFARIVEQIDLHFHER